MFTALVQYSLLWPKTKAMECEANADIGEWFCHYYALKSYVLNYVPDTVKTP